MLIGGAGADILDGGSGGETDGDTASYAASKMGVMVDLDEGTGMGGDAEGDDLDNIENVIGSDHADVLYGDDEDPDVLDGGKGNDMLRGGEGGDDVLTGGEGTDTVNYYDSGDGVTVNLSLTDAQPGDDGDAKDDVITGVENVQGSEKDDFITGNSVAAGTEGVQSNDLFGWKGDDEITGGAGADKLRGHMGDDIIGGMDGDDWIRGGEGADEITGGEGIDTVSYVGDAGVTVNLVLTDHDDDAGTTPGRHRHRRPGRGRHLHRHH